ncbi:MAG: enoyl-CoA hydratase-related protein [Mariniblastus sp.]|nr:enoyl-CoA hydratase-related protein [Mariniblastus sp.]
MPDFVKVAIESGVGRLTLHRPDKRNALKRQFIEEIQQGIAQLASEPALRVFLLQSEGSVFCAGMDLAEMQQRAESEQGQEEWQRDSQVFADTLKSLFQLPVPTIAVVQGPVLAGGMGLVLACDMILASDQAFFMLPEPARGITASMVTPFLIHRVGSGAASYMLLSGERVSAHEARNFGLCHDVVALDDLDDRCRRMVEAILTGSPSALAITKQHISDCAPTDVLADLEKSIHVSAQARETDDAREGLAAFLEKRKPGWQPE